VTLDRRKFLIFGDRIDIMFSEILAFKIETGRLFARIEIISRGGKKIKINGLRHRKARKIAKIIDEKAKETTNVSIYGIKLRRDK
jgi:hypothetical protein